MTRQLRFGYRVDVTHLRTGDLLAVVEGPAEHRGRVGNVGHAWFMFADCPHAWHGPSCTVAEHRPCGVATQKEPAHANA